VEFSSTGVRIAPGGFDSAGWAIATPSDPDPFPTAYAGHASHSYNLFDAELGLYGVMVAQATVLGEHEEHTSLSDVTLNEGYVASMLFTGGLESFWLDTIGVGSPIREQVRYAIPSPGVTALFAFAGVSAARRRR